MSTIEQAVDAKSTVEADFLAKRNVVGVGVGFKNQLGEDTGRASVVVLVQQKKPLSALTDEDLIPKEIDGLPTDVVEIGFLRAQALAPTARFRPIMQPGVSVAHYRVGAGTLGAVVRHRTTGQRYLLSNNHVLAASNDGLVGDDITQPGSLDGGMRPGDVIARLEAFKPLAYIEDAPANAPVVTPKPSTPSKDTETVQPTPPSTPSEDRAGCSPDLVDALVALANFLAQLTGSGKRAQALSLSAYNAMAKGIRSQAITGNSPAEVPMIASVDLDNLLDAAIARPLDPAMFSNEVLNIGRISGTKAPTLGMNVVKSGRTTGYTQGKVTLLNATVNVQYETSRGTRTARFVNQVITTGMSKSGDSGALIVDPTDRTAVGLLFAGSEFATIFTPIDRVLSYFNVEF